ncbi:MAG TPA: hypothetical protein VG938_01500 [Verrucomicrobiae bacterium]|jgi:hypothetical protein|nr:hypothetical protein [Verrucomicrobiae bacterium]
MKAKPIVQLAFGLLLIALANGCVTKALWTNNNLEAWNEPASNPNLRIFASPTRGDMLVVYDEYAERNDATRTRAYWLNENEKRLQQCSSPHFIIPNSLNSLTPIPVILPGTSRIDFPPPPYAQIEFNQRAFTLFLEDHRQAGPYNLPDYNDGKGKVEKFVLTPMAATADATIVGGFLGYLYIAARCGATGPLY